mgnify:CR=1 FL=1
MNEKNSSESMGTGNHALSGDTVASQGGARLHPEGHRGAVMIHQDADLAEYIPARDRAELKRHPRSPIVTSPKVAKDIDMSGVFRMSPEQVEAALLAEVA